MLSYNERREEKGIRSTLQYLPVIYIPLSVVDCTTLAWCLQRKVKVKLNLYLTHIDQCTKREYDQRGCT